MASDGEPGTTVDEAGRAAAMRVTDVERDEIVALLSTAASDGRLALDEYSERTDAALSAKVRGDLDRLTADLERGPSPAPATTSDETEQMTAILGNESRKGAWRVPPRIAARSILGDCHIELQEAHLTAHHTLIEAKATLGAVTVIVPEGVEVRLGGRAILGAKASHVVHRAPAGAPVVEVRANVLLGNVTVRPPSRAERIVRRVLGH